MDINDAKTWQPTPAALARLGPGEWTEIELKTDIGRLILSPAESSAEGLEMETHNDGAQRIYGRRENGRFKEIRIII